MQRKIENPNQISAAIRHKTKIKYRGIAIFDFESYLICRAQISRGFCPDHFLNLKKHYRRAFLNAPFRKGVK